ncbi:4-aminobutyrate aminotransferase [Dysgonomonas hofstadii]|uniref:4-aminobutyrate aminotransferase n=1 Tax=Dysgonomonas hofstadii TaxID=637886 RepID=A0A840CJH6_9BACT|nr:aspartate aminotransferase family protein [Dysgonomonas hofstadii]MBB4034829.1 4-aminobutyrate aminotransferase [Dysgonomonas hofstadii]
MLQDLRSEGDVNLSRLHTVWQNKLQETEASRFLERDKSQYLHQSLSTPCLDVLDRAEGVYLYAKSGKKYIDFHGNNVHQLGHKNPYIVDRIKTQMDVLPFSPRRFTNEPAIECAEKLASLMPSDLNRVLFAPAGTLAVGIALKLARVVTGKYKVVSVWDAFHGASMDAIAVGGEAQFRAGIGPLFPGVERIPPPMLYRGVFETDNDSIYADYLEYVVQKEGDIGAFIIETIRNTDVQIPSLAYWKRVREICDKYNILLILDEIPIAFGRSGKMFAFEHFGIEPDIICIGKGMGGGIFPMAGIVVRESFNIAKDISLGHYTHEKSPLGCVATLATIEYIEQNNILLKVQEDQAYIKERLDTLQSMYSSIGDVRGIGALWGIELVKDRKTKEPASDLAETILYRCLDNGLSFKVSKGNIIQLSPPLTISKKELDTSFDILRNAFKSSIN